LADSNILVKLDAAEVRDVGDEDGGIRLGSGHDQSGSSGGIGDRAADTICNCHYPIVTAL
jgi:hypothetical protein